MDHKLGCLKTHKDFRDYKLKSVKSTSLPASYRIPRKALVKNQKMVNSCVAHALSTFEEFIHSKNFSTDFIYGYRPFGYFIGEGMNIRDALHTLVHIGDCLNEKLPTNTEMNDVVELVWNKLETLEQDCSPYKIKSYARIFTRKQIQSCLINNIPVPVSIPVRGDLIVKNNLIQYDKAIPIDGYHAVLLIGYTEYGYIVQNSWGTNWGSSGLAILPYSYPLDSAWAINVNDNVIIKEPARWLSVVGNFILNIFNK